MDTRINIFWFRRDLRLADNAGLYHALKAGKPVVPVFIFDRNILDELEDRQDARVTFIHDTLTAIQRRLSILKVKLDARYGYPIDVFRALLNDYAIDTVFANHDYEPYAVQRDREVAELLARQHVKFMTFKDQVIFEKNEVVKPDGKPYTIFTPYARSWKQKLNDGFLRSYPVPEWRPYSYRIDHECATMPSLASMNFSHSGAIDDSTFPPQEWDPQTIIQYKERRDYPAAQGTTRLSVHLRFGTISIRQLARDGKALNETFLNELIWRDFYQMILWHFPGVVSHAFKPEYDRIVWRNDPGEFIRWCQGETGYPIVDAGMRELNATGYMHNRVRMIVASFLAKHLLIDWRWGEAYFAKKLLDYDLAANNGGWQWAAGTGCDAAPYFRIFNPQLQTKKFDAELNYVRKWVPELNESSYPLPIIDHAIARKRCLAVYKEALKK